MNSDPKYYKNPKLVLPEIDVYSSRSIKFITKPVLLTFSILIIVLLICSIISLNVKIENAINVKGILEPSNINNPQLNSRRVVILLNETDAGNISLGQSVELKISLPSKVNEEKLCSGKIASIDLEQNANGKESSISSNLYRINILLDKIQFEMNNGNNFNKAIQINAKIITNSELLFYGIIKQFKNIFNLF